MAIAADKVFDETMTSVDIEASDLRAGALKEEYFTLQELRKARTLTQVKVAEILGKKQVSIAQLEKRSDILLSTLRDYVSAIGGNLSLVVKFPDHHPVILSSLSEIFTDDQESPATRTPAKKVQKASKQS